MFLGVWQFIWSPVAWIESQLRRDPNWRLACLAPAACALLQVGAALVVASKVSPGLEAVNAALGVGAGLLPASQAFAFFGLVGFPIACGAAIGTLVFADALCGGSGRPERLAETALLCFYSHLPYTFYLLVAAWWWEAPSLAVQPGASLDDVRRAAGEFELTVLESPLFVIGRLLSAYAAVWLMALLGVVLHVESRLPAWQAGLVAGACAVGWLGVGRVGHWFVSWS